MIGFRVVLLFLLLTALTLFTIQWTREVIRRLPRDVAEFQKPEYKGHGAVLITIWVLTVVLLSVVVSLLWPSIPILVRIVH